VIVIIRLIVAAAEEETLTLVAAVLQATHPLLSFEVAAWTTSTRAALLARVDARADDVVLLDWGLAAADTPGLIEDLFQRNPHLRILALLPQPLQPYRSCVWQAGACASIAREHIDQEWLASVLCVIHRALAREASLRAEMETLARRMMEIQAECSHAARDLRDDVSESLPTLVKVDTEETPLKQG
jgi:DNA-binding NarL/FixJ family response regulator